MTAQPLWKALHMEVLEFFWLRRAEMHLGARSAAEEEEVIHLVRAADRRREFAPGVGSPDATAISVALFREALALLIRAHTVDRGGVPADASLEPLCDGEASAPTDWRKLLPLLRETDTLVIDGMSLDELRSTAAVLLTTYEWLRRRIDTRSVFHLRWLRRGRLTAIGLVLVLGLGSKLIELISPKNVALGKGVTMTSLHMGSPPGAALVDGIESGRHPAPSKVADIVQTNMEAEPSATIDLGQVYHLAEIRVFNRDDDDFDDGLPYTVDLSDDGSSFTMLGRRVTHFGSGILDPPWTLDARHQSARFIRIRCDRYLALSEVEVFGR